MLTSSKQNVCRREISLSHFADEDRAGPSNASLFAIQPPNTAQKILSNLVAPKALNYVFLGSLLFLSSVSLFLSLSSSVSLSLSLSLNSSLPHSTHLCLQGQQKSPCHFLQLQSVVRISFFASSFPVIMEIAGVRIFRFFKINITFS